MASSSKLLATSLVTLVFLSACASTINVFSIGTPTEIFYRDGKTAYVAACKSTNWGPCLERAGKVCKNAGYTILEKNGNRNYGEEEKELVFACNGKPDAVEKQPKSSETRSEVSP